MRGTIVFDNGGGVTIQNNDHDNPYQHHYLCGGDQVATDIKALLDGDDMTMWDDNEWDLEYGFLSPSYDDIRNGGYRDYTIDEFVRMVRAGELDDVCWYNIKFTAEKLEKIL
jgi:hypothetical protein